MSLQSHKTVRMYHFNFIWSPLRFERVRGCWLGVWWIALAWSVKMVRLPLQVWVVRSPTGHCRMFVSRLCIFHRKYESWWISKINFGKEGSKMIKNMHRAPKNDAPPKRNNNFQIHQTLWLCMTGALLLFVIAGEVSGAHRNFNHIQPTDICEKVTKATGWQRSIVRSILKLRAMLAYVTTLFKMPFLSLRTKRWGAQSWHTTECNEVCQTCYNDRSPKKKER